MKKNIPLVLLGFPKDAILVVQIARVTPKLSSTMKLSGWQSTVLQPNIPHRLCEASDASSWWNDWGWGGVINKQTNQQGKQRFISSRLQEIKSHMLKKCYLKTSARSHKLHYAKIQDNHFIKEHKVPQKQIAIYIFSNKSDMLTLYLT